MRNIAALSALVALNAWGAAPATEHFNFQTAEAWVAIGTLLLCVVTAVLAYFTYQLWNDAKKTSDRQAKEMQQSLGITRATSMPFLRPTLEKSRINLYDRINKTNHENGPSVYLGFTNVGATAAMVHRYGAVMRIIEDEKLNALEHDPKLRMYERSDIIQSKETGAIEEVFLGQLLRTDQIDLLEEDWQPGAKKAMARLYVQGVVEYDDIYNYRHTCRFLVKVRQTGWYQQRGGREFNYVTRRPISDATEQFEATAG